MFRHVYVVCLCLVCILWQFSCCVDFASLDVVCDELNDCAWYLGL